MHNNSVLFYTQNRWAFGQIHHALIKRLWENGIYSNLLDWGVQYTYKEFDLLFKKYATISTSPEPLSFLKGLGLPLSRIVVVAHHEKDLVNGLVSSQPEDFDDLKSFAVVHKDLIAVAKNLGIKRTPAVVRNGLDFDHYYEPVNGSLQVLGYAGEIKSLMSNNTDFKRSHLVKEVSDKIKLPVQQHEHFNHLCMAGYYETIDALLVSSSYETAGLPALEAAAAGKLVLSTPVGYFDGSYGISCRLPEHEFVSDAVAGLVKHAEPKIYKATCEQAQQYVRDHYDWSVTVTDWVKLFI